MELFFIFGFILFLSLSLVSLLIFYYQYCTNNHDHPLPPGKMGWPVVGESWEFLSTGWIGQPEKFIFDRLSKYGPSQVFKTSLLMEKMVVMCGPSCNKFLFSNENKLVRTWFPSSVNKIFPTSTQTSSSEESMKLRKLLLNFLKPEALQRYIPIMDTITKQHFTAEWEGKDEVKVLPVSKRYTLWLASRLFLNIEDPAYIAKFDGLFNNISTGIISVPIDLPGTPFNRGIKAANSIKEEVRDIIKQRRMELADGRGSPTQDILSCMLLTPDADGKYMSENDIADKTLAILIGGHETTSGACTFVVKYLAELPHVYDAVYKEQMEIARSKGAEELLNWEDIQKMKYSWNVACEVMRLAPSVQGAFREAMTDFTYGGFRFPKGWKLYWSAHSTHKNPEYFPEPEKFDPSRFEGKGPAPYTYVPFGGGPRMCPGKEYARLEILVFMHNLVKRFRWEKVLSDEKIVVNPMPVPANGLPIRLYPHLKTPSSA